MKVSRDNDIYQQERIELKEGGESLFAKIPECCAQELAIILTNFEKSSLPLKTIEKKRHQVEVLKHSISLQTDIQAATTQELMKYLGQVDRLLKGDEKYCYFYKIFVDTFWNRFWFFFKSPSSVRDVAFNPTVHSILQNIADSIAEARLSLEQLKDIASFGKAHNDIDQLIPHVHIALERFSAEYLHAYSVHLSDQEKDLMISTAKNLFSEVGNNKARFFQRPKQVDHLDALFEEHMRADLEDYLSDFVSTNASSYRTPATFLYDIAAVLALLYLEGNIHEQYLQFAQAHINDLFQSIQKRKMNNASSSPRTSISHTFNETIRHTFPKKAISQEFFEYLTNFLEPLPLSAQQKSDVRHFFLRMQRNGKEIRILDAEKKFGMKKTLFSEEQIQAFEKFGCPIVFPTADEIAQEVQEEIPLKKAPPHPNLIKPEYPERPLYDALLADMKHFSREKVLDIFEIIGYEIEDRNTFVKQLEKLFGSEMQKKQFLRSLKNNIRQLNKKSQGYRTIEIIGEHRILFFRQNLIDGIYNHPDYIKRVWNVLC